jgi:predicted amidohydrolase
VRITVSVAQLAVARSEWKRNLEKGAAAIAEAARHGSDIVCFPEMWTTGFDWEANKRLARSTRGRRTVSRHTTATRSSSTRG